MKPFKITIAGKSFIAGEYLALTGEGALVAALNPRFQLIVRDSDFNKKTIQANSQLSLNCPFHLDSPAGKYWLQNQDFFKKFHLNFQDPHCGKGGWGGSTAEFALLYLLKNSLNLDNYMLTDVNAFDSLNEYQNLFSNELKYKPSGADLMAQLSGGISGLEKNKMKNQIFKWNFSNLGLYFVKTLDKLKTHEHLETLENLSVKNLKTIYTDILHSISTNDSKEFVKGINSYSDELDSLGLLSTNSKQILDDIEHSTILAKKGCGAMGADVLFFVYDKTVKNSAVEIENEIKNNGLKVVATEFSIADKPIVEFLDEAALS